MGIAGHVSREMLNHYSHLRMNAKREALELLDGNMRSVVTPKTAEQGNREGAKVDPAVFVLTPLLSWFMFVAI